MEFHHRDGTVHGFPYAHLLNFHYQTNQEADLQPHAAPEKFDITFSTHEVSLFGWQLKTMISMLASGKLASVHTVDPRYYGLARIGPFVCEIRLRPIS